MQVAIRAANGGLPADYLLAGTYGVQGASSHSRSEWRTTRAANGGLPAQRMADYPRTVIAVATLGFLSLVASCVASLLAAAVGSRAAGLVRPALSAAAGLALVSLGCLIISVMSQDFGLAYVAAHSRRTGSSIYRLAALWGGAEGSLLLFAALLVAVGAACSWRLTRRRAAVVAALLCAVPLVTVALFANPFERLALPAARGAGLTPILEHPAMLYHPPILYLGLVMTLRPLLFGLDGTALGGTALGGRGLADGRRGGLAAVPWALLTVGLATGANWAYVEVGWGGYWAWDPVENTVLLPWLALGALLHAERSPGFRQKHRWTSAVLLGLPFVLVAFGSAVTRSGGLSSVHAFADSRAIGWSLGVFVVLALIAVGGLVQQVHRERTIEHADFKVAVMVVPVALAAIVGGVVLLGVAYPLVVDGDPVVLGRFYARIAGPVALLAAALLAVSGFHFRQPLSYVAPGVGAAFGVCVAFVVGWTSAFALAVCVVSGLAVASLGVDARRGRPLSMLLGHVGFVILLLGIAGSTRAESVRVNLLPGTSQGVAGIEFVYEDFEFTEGPRDGTEQRTTRVAVFDGATRLATLEPALVFYPQAGVVLPETGLHSRPRRDIQAVLRLITADGRASFELSVRPAVTLVWWGSVVLAIAGGMAWFRSRRKATSNPRDRLGHVSD